MWIKVYSIQKPVVHCACCLCWKKLGNVAIKYNLLFSINFDEGPVILTVLVNNIRKYVPSKVSSSTSVLIC